jgi:hypothetical protein
MRHAVLAFLDARTIRAISQRSRYADAWRDVPRALLPLWRKAAPGEFPGIPFQARFYARSLDALLTFFDCAARSDRPCGLPSRAADAVWHAWMQMDRDNLEQFCRRHFGRTIPHVEAGDMQGQMGKALGTCLVAARKLDFQPPVAPCLPRLFTLDRELRMPLGFGYTIEQGRVAWSRLDAAGLPHGPSHHPDHLSPYGLFAAGLVSASEYDLGAMLAARHRDGAAGQPGGGCAAIMPDSGGGHAAACTDGAGGDSAGDGDAGGDGGSSCGGGCGGD